VAGERLAVLVGAGNVTGLMGRVPTGRSV